MADIEKVIKGIRKCLSHKPCSENKCPYENECAVEHLNDPLLRDALELLKEQETETELCDRCGWVRLKSKRQLELMKEKDEEIDRLKMKLDEAMLWR